jgi:hypothetical protein
MDAGKCSLLHAQALDSSEKRLPTIVQNAQKEASRRLRADGFEGPRHRAEVIRTMGQIALGRTRELSHQVEVQAMAC